MMTKIMKHLFAASLVCCCITATLTGCQMKEDDLFEMDAANRSDAWMADYRRVFNNNDYGWALYTMNPTSTSSLGGYLCREVRPGEQHVL